MFSLNIATILGGFPITHHISKREAKAMEHILVTHTWKKKISRKLKKGSDWFVTTVTVHTIFGHLASTIIRKIRRMDYYGYYST